jgi:hypothetical protein
MDLGYFRDLQKECSYHTKIVFKHGKYDEMCNHTRNFGRKCSVLDCPVIEWQELIGQMKAEDSKKK